MPAPRRLLITASGVLLVAPLTLGATAIPAQAAGSSAPVTRVSSSPGAAPVLRTTAEAVQPLERAHAHNDYLHLHPLHDALSYGFTSVEADVFLVGTDLRLGHAVPSPTRTLQNTYLDPLRRIVADNGGHVLPGYTGRFRLYIDLKTSGETWQAVEKALAAYPELITHWENGTRVSRPVEVVITGNRSLATIADAPVRWSAADGHVPDLTQAIDRETMPTISDDWSSVFTWRGIGPMPADQRAKLHHIVATAHAQGKEVRFWNTPDVTGPIRTNVWREMLQADVDQFNSDDLAGLETYLKANDPDERP